MQMETFLHRTGAGRKRDRSTEIYPQPYVSANLYGFCRCPSPLRGAAPLFPARRDIPNWPLCGSDGHNAVPRQRDITLRNGNGFGIISDTKKQLRLMDATRKCILCCRMPYRIFQPLMRCGRIFL